MEIDPVIFAERLTFARRCAVINNIICEICCIQAPSRELAKFAPYRITLASEWRVRTGEFIQRAGEVGEWRRYYSVIPETICTTEIFFDFEPFGGPESSTNLIFAHLRD